MDNKGQFFPVLTITHYMKIGLDNCLPWVYRRRKPWQCYPAKRLLTACDLGCNNQNKIDRNKVKKERYLIRQDNTIYQFLIKLYFSSIGQDKSKLQ